MMRWVFLTSVFSEVEADIIIGLLEQEGIPAKKAYPGAGNLKSTYGLINGVEVYVSEDDAQQAKEILNADRQEVLCSFPEAEPEQ